MPCLHSLESSTYTRKHTTAARVHTMWCARTVPVHASCMSRWWWMAAPAVGQHQLRRRKLAARGHSARRWLTQRGHRQHHHPARRLVVLHDPLQHRVLRPVDLPLIPASPRR